MTRTAQHQGRHWMQDADGDLSWWDGKRWQPWSDKAGGPAPPPEFLSSQGSSAQPSSGSFRLTGMPSASAKQQFADLPPGQQRIATVIGVVALLLILGALFFFLTEGGSLSSAGGGEAIVRVEAPPASCWSGSIGDATQDGCGTREIPVDGVGGIYSANAQKQSEGDWSLSIILLVDGEEVDRSTTTAEYGIAQVVGP